MPPQHWIKFQSLGQPLDSYGMPYKMPIGMLSLERFADIPIFVGTSNNYGNSKWGGIEYLDIIGYNFYFFINLFFPVILFVMFLYF